MSETTENELIACDGKTSKHATPGQGRFRLLVASLAPLPLNSRAKITENAAFECPQLVDCKSDEALKKFCSLTPKSRRAPPHNLGRIQRSTRTMKPSTMKPTTMKPGVSELPPAHDDEASVLKACNHGKKRQNKAFRSTAAKSSGTDQQRPP